jgi:hypothetical protein
VVHEKEAAKTEEREESWTVEVEGIDVKIAELWFMEYRYLGDGTLKGEFLVGPAVMRVGTSVQDLGPGQLRFGADHVIAENFGGRVSATIPEVNPEEHADESFLDLVTARIALKGDVQSMKHIGAYFESIDVAEGKGPFKADVALEKGWLGSKSSITYQTDSIRVNGAELAIETDWKLDIDVQTEDAKAAPADTKTPPVRGSKPANEKTRPRRSFEQSREHGAPAHSIQRQEHLRDFLQATEDGLHGSASPAQPRSNAAIDPDRLRHGAQKSIDRPASHPDQRPQGSRYGAREGHAAQRAAR